MKKQPNCPAKKLLVLGAYGCGNRGDDAILQSIAENFPEYDITVTSGTSDDIASIFGVKTIRCRMNEGFSFSVFMSVVKDSFRILFSLLRSDALIFGGGSLIHDLTPYNLIFMYFWHRIALIFNKKVYYYAMGVGPIDTKRGKKLSKRYLSKANLLFVRDMRGKMICDSLCVDSILTNDAAFSVNKKNQCNASSLVELGLIANQYVCVTASGWFESANFWKRDNVDFEGQTANFVACLKTLNLTINKPLVFVPTVKYDLIIGKKIAESFDECRFRIVPESYNCKQMAEIIENSYMLFGVRMHSIIFAARQGVPFMAAIYDQKVYALLEILGMGEYGVALSELTPLAVEKIAQNIIVDYDKVHQNLQLKSAKFYNNSLRCIQMIRDDMQK